MEETDAAAATKTATSDSSSTVIRHVAANTADSDGEDASATSANTILIIDPTHAEVGTAAFSSAPANTVATEGRDSVDTTINAERHNAQSGAVAVVGGNESPAVSVSYSASSTAYSSSITEFVIRSDINRSIINRSKKITDRYQSIKHKTDRVVIYIHILITRRLTMDE